MRGMHWQTQNMAIASGRTAWVMARPLFRRPNLDVLSLNTREVVKKLVSWAPHLRQWLPIVVQISWTKGNVESEFSAISMAIPLLWQSVCCLGSLTGLNNLLQIAFSRWSWQARFWFTIIEYWMSSLVSRALQTGGRDPGEPSRRNLWFCVWI